MENIILNAGCRGGKGGCSELQDAPEKIQLPSDNYNYNEDEYCDEYIQNEEYGDEPNSSKSETLYF